MLNIYLICNSPKKLMYTLKSNLKLSLYNKKMTFTKEYNQRVKLEIINQIAHVTLIRSDKLNALDLDMFKAIDLLIKNLKNNRDIRVVIVSAQGKDFCSGLDVKSVMKSSFSMIKLLFKVLPWQSNLAQRTSTGWQKIPVPVIMAIHGRCWGGGLQLALGGDIKIITPTASLSIMESNWGLIPDMGGTLALRQLTQIDIAKELAMTAKMFDGNEALKMGLVTHVNEEPLVKAQEIAELICQQSPDSVAAVKKLYNKSWFGSDGLALARETYYQVKIFLSKNIKIKIFNQTHEEKEHKAFKLRGRW